MTQGTCRFCGGEGEGTSFQDWVKPTFTDWDKLLPGDIVCAGCLFWFDEASEILTRRTGKDKPQRMRNYSHFVVNGEWEPLSKGDKARMRALLLTPPFPELAAIADSGQKHIVFRAARNAPGCTAGWVQFEERRLWIDPPILTEYLDVLNALLSTFSKGELETGQYAAYRIHKFGLDKFLALESRLRAWRGSLLFSFALFLAQRSADDDDGNNAGGRSEADGGDALAGDLARDTQELQGKISPDDLGAVRERDRERGLHEQSGPLRQLSMWET